MFKKILNSDSVLKDLQKISNKTLNYFHQGSKFDVGGILYSVFKKIGEEKNIVEFQELNENNYTKEYIITTFLKHNSLKKYFVEKYFPDFIYYETLTELEEKKFNINYFLTLPEKEKNVFFEQKNILITDQYGKKWVGLFFPSINIDIDFDEIFFFGNNIYNYYFSQKKDLTFLKAKETILVKDILQYMESNGINDIGIDPINSTQYIFSAEIAKQNVILTPERPILKSVIDPLFNEIKTKTGVDTTTEFPTITSLMKIDLIGNKGIHTKRTFRMNFIKVKAGYTLSIRRFMNYDEINALGLRGLNYNEESIDIINEAIEDKTGVNIILGETNSGKSTLLAAILNQIYQNKQKIISIENPIEIEMPYLQIDLTDTETADEQFKMTKEIAQKAILRHNPNVVLMSEIRTHDEIDFFTGLGLRGHMALATLHAGSIQDAIQILLKVADEISLKNILNLFVHQELLAKKCYECKNISGKKEKCPVCEGKGVHGVIPVFEIIKFGHLDKEDSLEDLSSIIKKGKAKYISKVDIAEYYKKRDEILEEDYKRILKNNIKL